MKAFNLFILILLGLFLMACGADSTASLESAKKAISNVDALRYCDPSTYELIKEKYEKAQELAQKDQHEEAEKNAKIAEQLSLELSRKYKKPCPDPNALKAKKIKEEDTVEENNDEPVVLEMVDDLKTVYFSFDSYQLDGEAQQTILNNINWLKANPKAKVSLRGHTDTRGSNEYNMALSEKRARTIYHYLEAQALDMRYIEAVGYGEEQPASFSDSEAGHAQNRRVEFWEKK
jgi:peptidoglycan-associated lipoprotein